MRLFGRRWRLEIGNVAIDGTSDRSRPLDCSFSVEKTSKREPNTCALKVRNLSPLHRTQLSETRAVSVKLDAGYVDQIGTIFAGDLRDHRIYRDGQDVVMELEGEDGGRAYRDARIQRSFGPGIAVATVLRACVEAMAIGEGNLAELGATAQLQGAGAIFPHGTALSGRASTELDRIVRSCGLTWSVQDGALQLRRAGVALRTTAVRLTPATGLVGSPSKDKDGRISATALLMPGLYPGRPVVLESSEIRGSYEVSRVKYSGDTAGNEWQAELELKER